MEPTAHAHTGTPHQTIGMPCAQVCRLLPSQRRPGGGRVRAERHTGALA
ncbi:MAG: hypothetical protein WBC31_14220 [Candidatus Phosphoribacter baldrii]|nr:hypothetical protein [Dermatophilaceae bacterium]